MYLNLKIKSKFTSVIIKCKKMEIALPDFDDRLYQRTIFYYSRFAFTNKTDRHNITEILLKVALSTTTHSHLLACIICELSSRSKVARKKIKIQRMW
jgi:hypothetical protein